MYIIEFAVNLRDVHGSPADRFFTQTRIFETMTAAGLESGLCRSFIDFQVGDSCEAGLLRLIRAQQAHPHIDAG